MNSRSVQTLRPVPSLDGGVTAALRRVIAVTDAFSSFVYLFQATYFCFLFKTNERVTAHFLSNVAVSRSFVTQTHRTGAVRIKLKLHNLPSQSQVISVCCLLRSLFALYSLAGVDHDNVVLGSRTDLAGLIADFGKHSPPNFGVVGVGQDTVSLTSEKSILRRTDLLAGVLSFSSDGLGCSSACTDPVVASLSLRETGCMSPCRLACRRQINSCCSQTTSRSFDRDWCTEIIQGNKGENSDGKVGISSKGNNAKSFAM